MQQTNILGHERITAAGAEPDRWLFVLHGIYGMGRNWKSVSRRAIDARPDWGAVLVDLREHGESKGFARPHTLEAAAADLGALAWHLGIGPAGILGHSFGGKVALVFAREHSPPLEQVWVVDSTPAVREPSGSAWAMLDVLRRVPGPFESRRDAVGALEAEGVATGVAQWISTNLDRADGEYRWALELDAMDELLRDFFRTDAWDVIESPPDGLEVRVIKAEKSNVLDAAAVERIEAAAAGTGRVALHRVAGGHWLNADNPDALQTLLEQHLPR